MCRGREKGRKVVVRKEGRKEERERGTEGGKEGPIRVPKTLVPVGWGRDGWSLHWCLHADTSRQTELRSRHSAPLTLTGKDPTRRYTSRLASTCVVSCVATETGDTSPSQ